MISGQNTSTEPSIPGLERSTIVATALSALGLIINWLFVV